jgi:hypothetical protein
MAHRLEPIAPEPTSVECSWCLPPSVSDATYAVEFWDELGVDEREDREHGQGGGWSATAAGSRS